jgi:hypothetical protein
LGGDFTGGRLSIIRMPTNASILSSDENFTQIAQSKPEATQDRGIATELVARGADDSLMR